MIIDSLKIMRKGEDLKREGAVEKLRVCTINLYSLNLQVTAPCSTKHVRTAVLFNIYLLDLRARGDVVSTLVCCFPLMGIVARPDGCSAFSASCFLSPVVYIPVQHISVVSRRQFGVVVNHSLIDSDLWHNGTLWGENK